MANRDYGSLVAGMRHRPTIFDAAEVLKKDYKIRFPDRRAITLFNTPELSQFRGVQEAHDAMEERQHNAQLEQMELRRAARNSDTSVPDMQFVAAEVMRSRQSEGALQEAMASHAAVQAQQLRGMQEETAAQMARIAAEAATAAKRSELAERAMEGFRDMHAEHRAALGAIAEQMGRAPVQIDQSVTNNVQNVTQIDERSIHNIAMQAVNAGAAQIGAAMAQGRMSEQAMMQSLLDHARSHQQTHNHVHFYNIGTPPNEPADMQVSSGPPPPPAPGAGAVRRGRPRTKRTPYDSLALPVPGPPPPPPPPAPPALPIPVPAPEPPPTAPATVRYSAPKRPRTRSAPPRAKAKARPSAVPSPLMPEVAVVPAPKPSMAGELQMDTAAPSAAPPKPSRARAKPSAKPVRPSTARPNPAPIRPGAPGPSSAPVPSAPAPSAPAIMWTTGPMSTDALPPKRPRTGGLGKGRGSAQKAAPKSKGRGGGRVNAEAVAAAVGKEPPAPKPKSAPRRNKIPAAGPPVKKTIVKKVPLDEGDMEAVLKPRRRNKA